eukprot:TRINITY_DN307_c0_g1_i1.p1 TRINITY_DN307_c0_g1~~TRINITY_DN307_c0_g1_i1.p1  ORF type:complete len:150 (-),score=28.19 TRINITY_DN307_c0_g1_i1:92-541(-)
MKYNKNVSSARRKQRKAHFAAPSHERRKRMSSTLSTDLRTKHSIRALPIRKDDEVTIMTGEHKGREGKVTTVYRKKYCIYIEKVTREKANGATVHIPINASNVQITKLKLDKSRKALIERKAKGRAAKKGQEQKNKFTESTVSTMSTID